MVDLSEMIFMGIWAIFFMDILAIFVVKLKLVRATIEPQIVGRWTLYTKPWGQSSDSQVLIWFTNLSSTI